MPKLPENHFYIEHPEALEALIKRLRRNGGGRCAVDTEADSLHSYREKLCLIQFSSGDYHAIIDPLRIENGGMEPLVEFLDQAEVWMHGADFDMTMLKRRFDKIPLRVFDTQTAARLCGARQFGLAYLVQQVFGVTLSKQGQRANWAKRPLLDKMIDYALNDVRYILPLADHYSAKLRELNRWEWFLESCSDARESVANRPPPDLENLWRIPGSGKLKPFGLNCLRALWQWRDREAERMDRPAFKIIGNMEIIAFAEAMQAGQEPQLPERFPASAARRFQKAVRQAKDTPQDQWPRRRFGTRAERTSQADKIFEELKAKRDKSAQELDLDPALIASRFALEMISLFPDSVDEHLLSWQRGLIGL